jgi:thiosulfate/3-mercaptopyruvate sulfurtransferase
MTFSVIALTGSVLGLSASAAFAAGLGPLVTPADLDAALRAENAPAVLDIRGNDYATGHIDGAISAPYNLFRGPAENPGQLVPIEKLEATYEGLGLQTDAPIVIVAQGTADSDFGAASRVYWTLKSSGFTQLSILNGGAQAWVNAGLPVSTETVTPQPSAISVSWDNTWTAETPEIAEVVAGKREAVLLDARPTPFFEGLEAHEIATRPGTLPGAQSYPHTNFFQPGATAVKPIADVQTLKATLGIAEREEVVSFCNTGHWAATNWFALNELAGLGNVKLYPGSMVEYSHGDLQMANTPGLLQNFLNQFREKE